jgi:hypothetical protein
MQNDIVALLPLWTWTEAIEVEQERALEEQPAPFLSSCRIGCNSPKPSVFSSLGGLRRLIKPQRAVRNLLHCIEDLTEVHR